MMTKATHLHLTWDDPQSGERIEQVFPLPVTIGRDTGNTVVIPSTSVSRNHCAIEFDGNEITITDLGSSNGTFVNGKRIEKAQLSSGDKLIIGEVKVALAFTTEDRRIRSKPSMDSLYSVLGESEPTITLKEIRSKKLFADVSSEPEDQPPDEESESERISGEELKTFLSGRLQKDLDEDIHEDIDTVASTFNTNKETAEHPRVEPSQEERSSKSSTGLLGFIRRILGSE